MTKNLKTNNLPYLFKNHYWLLLVLCCFFFSLFSQDKGFVVPDSLKNKDLKELEEGYFKNNKNFKIAEIYAKTILINGKKDRNNVNIAKAFRHLSNLNENNELELIYLDSIININFKKENLIYKAAALFTEGAYFDEKNRYSEAFDNYNLSLKIAEKQNKTKLINNINYNIGVLKGRIGRNKESLEIFKKYHIYCQDMLKINFNYNKKDYLVSLFSLSNAYYRNNNLDSAEYYNSIGIEKSKVFDDKKLHTYFILNKGKILCLKENYTSSIKNILNSIPILIDIEDNLNLSVAYHYLGKSYFKIKNTAKGEFFLKKMDSIIKQNPSFNYRYEERDGYKLLINYYKKNKKPIKQLIFINKLLKLDSLLYLNSININKNLILKLDTPKLFREKERLINVLKTNSKHSIFFIYSLILLTLILLSVSIYFKYRHSLFKKRFDELINKSNIQIPLKEGYKIHQEKQLISKEKAEPILKKLIIFENNLDFLEIKLTQNILARNINTNSTYLSKVINQYKQTNFSTYINNLRVEYAIKKLKEDKKLHIFSINGMANEFGFNNSETFSKAFYKKTGIYPSYFIKQLKKIKI